MSSALPLLAPASLAIVGLIYMRADMPRGSQRLRIGEFAALGALAVSILSLALLIRDGAGTGPLIGAAGLGSACPGSGAAALLAAACPHGGV